MSNPTEQPISHMSVEADVHGSVRVTITLMSGCRMAPFMDAVFGALQGLEAGAADAEPRSPETRH